MIMSFPKTVGPKSLIPVTNEVSGCKTPVVKDKFEVVKYAIETDSPILHSIPNPDPPPLFKVEGVIDCEKDGSINEKKQHNKTINLPS